jgi:hypothetical protein
MATKCTRCLLTWRVTITWQMLEETEGRRGCVDDRYATTLGYPEGKRD